LLRLRGEAASRFPPGESTAVLVSCVHDVVNLVWGAFFTFIRLLSSLVTLLFIALVHVKTASLSVIGAVLAVFLGMPLIVFALFRLHLSPCADLAARKTKWNLKMFGLAAEQVASFRRMPTPASEAEVARAAQDFGDIAFVYRKRAFHSYFMDLVSQDTVKEFCVLCYAGLCFLMGREAIGSRVRVSEFVVLAAAVSSLSQGLSTLASLMVGLPHGHAALVVISDVVNSDEEGQDLAEDSEEETADSESESVALG